MMKWITHIPETLSEAKKIIQYAGPLEDLNPDTREKSSRVNMEQLNNDGSSYTLSKRIFEK